MSASISTASRGCLRVFNVLITEGQWKTQESQLQWKDELGRLRIWSANVGAHQTGTASLEYRLRDASHVRNHVVDLLLDLEKLLLDVKEELLPSEGEDEEEEDITNESQSQDQNDEAEVDELLRDTRDILQCLFEMAMLIRKPAHHDRTLGFDRAETKAFEHYDREHVHHKFPRASSEVTDRIGMANSRRRQYFKYRERHQAKLAKGLDEDDSKSSVLLSNTVASEFVELEIISDDTQSTTDLSQTSYAPSLDVGSALTVPTAPPESRDGMPFECPYCFCIISVRNRRAWIKHVFQDLQPYTCVWKGCPLSRKSWDSRKEWLKHITNHSEASSLISDPTGNNIECPLCFEVRQGTSFEHHVGRHLEDLALWVLPRTNNDSDEEHSEATMSSRKSTASMDETPLPPPSEQPTVAAGDLSTSPLPPGTNNDYVEVDAHTPAPQNSRNDLLHHASQQPRHADDDDYENAPDDDEDVPDIIRLRHLNAIYRLLFKPYAISDGLVTIGDIRYFGAEHLGHIDPKRVKLLYKGKQLKNDQKTAKAEGLKQKSEIIVVISEVAESTSRNDLDEDIYSLLDSDTSKKNNPQDLKDPREKMSHLTTLYTTQWAPVCREYLLHPPTDAKTKEFEHKRLTESILSQIILKADDFDLQGDNQARQQRKALLIEAQEMLRKLDAAVRKKN